MARIVCQILHRPNRVTFVWSEGPACFEPYHLEGAEGESFYQAARSARQCLSRVAAADPQALPELAQAGHELYRALFRHNTNDPQARTIQHWVNGLRQANALQSLEMLGDVPGRIPWNLVYDQTPNEQALRSGDPAALKAFWGLHTVLGVGKRANPLRIGCVLDRPNIMLAADRKLVETLPAPQRNLLSDWAISHELTVMDSVTAVRNKLLDEAPDILYLFAGVNNGAMRLGDETITIRELRDLLTAAKEGNPDPIVFLQASAPPADWQAWECFLGEAVTTLSGVVMSEIPLTPPLANVLGVEALTRFVESQQIGQALKEVRASHGPAALAYSAFCPAHLKICAAGDADADTPAPALFPLPESPYRPLASFDAEDRGLFAGREDDTVRCASLVDEASTPGLVVHGTGGVGKTSFLRAGLLPFLETEAVGYLALRDRTPDEDITDERAYPVVALRPGADLLGQLAEALCVFCAQAYRYTTPDGNEVVVDLPQILRAAVHGSGETGITAAPPTLPAPTAAVSSSPVPGSEPPEGQNEATGSGPVAPEDLWRALVRDPGLLAALVDKLTRRLPFDLVLALEQAEDLVLQVTKAEEARSRHALAVLGSVLRSPARCKVLLSARTEYLGRLMDNFSPGPERWRNFFVDELSAEQMLNAIMLPTAVEPVPFSKEIPRNKYGFTFEHDLAPAIVKDVRRAAWAQACSPLPLLQAVCADLYERMKARNGDQITKADRKSQGPVGKVLGQYVQKRIKELPLAAGDRPALQKVMDQLTTRHTDGTISRELVPTREIAESWKSPTPLTTVVDTASQGGLVEENQLLVHGRPEVYLSLPQESLAQAVSHWDEESKRNAFGRTRIIDTLWIMVPLLFLVAAITWTLTRRAAASANPEESATGQEELAKRAVALQAQLDLSRWPIYVGALARAESAWKNGNGLLARQILLAQQAPPKQSELRDFEWYYLWRQLDQGRGPDSAGQQGELTSVAMSADGNIGASAAGGGSVKVWDLNSGEEIATLKGHVGPVLAVAFSPDGKSLASAGADKVIRLWDTPAASGKPAVLEKEQKKLTGHTDAVNALVFGPGGLVSGGADKLVILWDLATGKEKQVFKGHTAAVLALALAPDGKTIASVGADQAILIHDGAKATQTIKAPGPVVALAFSPDGKTLASGGMERQGSPEQGSPQHGSIRFWDTGTGKETSTNLRHASGVLSLAYLPQTKLLASAGKDNVLRVWDPATGRQASDFKGHLGWVTSVAVASKGSRLFTASRDGTVKIWDTAAPDKIAAHEGAATAVVFAPGDKAVISGGHDGTIKFWDPATGKLLKQLTGLGAVTSLALAAGETPARLAAGTRTDKDEGEVRLWDVSWDAKEGLKTKELPVLKGHTKGVTCVAFTADGRVLASGSADQTAIVWDVEASKPRFVLKGHDGGVRCLAFPGGLPADGPPILLTGGADGKVRHWDVKDGQEFRPPLQAHAGAVNAVAYFFGIVGFVTAGEDHSTKFWVWNPTEQPEVRNSHRSNSQALTAMAFSPKRRFLAVASEDPSIKIYDSQIDENRATRFFAQERFTFTDLGTPLRAVAVSANGLMLAAAGDDGTIRLLRAAEKK